MMRLSKEKDMRDVYNVDEYITAVGLSVDPEYRRQGIASQLLGARYEFKTFLIFEFKNFPIFELKFFPIFEFKIFTIFILFDNILRFQYPFCFLTDVFVKFFFFRDISVRVLRIV